MKKRTNNHWTEAKDRLIIDLIERGETPMKHPALLAEHSPDAILVRCSTLRKQGRLPRVQKQYTWAEDEHRLIELVKKGLSPREDPELMSRHSEWAINKRCSILRKKGIISKATRTKRGWTEEEKELVKQLLLNGERPALNETLLARHSANAIIIYASKFNISPKEFNNRLWTDEEERLIVELLRKGERPQFNPTLQTRHTRQAIIARCYLIRAKGLSTERKATETAFKAAHSVILNSMVSPLQRKAIIGKMFNG